MQSIFIISGEGDTVLFNFLNAFRSKLTWYLAGCALLSGVLAIGVGYFIIQWGIDFVDTYFDDPEVNRTFQSKYVEDLQEYVNNNEITAANISELQNWTMENEYVYLAVYRHNKLIFNSDYTYYDTELNTTGELEEETYIESEEIYLNQGNEMLLLDEEYLYQMRLADDSIASVDMFCYDYWQYYYYIFGIGVVIGAMIFIGMLTRLLKNKLGYISVIERELQILEGGNLEYPITIKGTDEISNLARGIDQLRRSVIEDRRREQKMLQANKELVTAMSHDLRTPLTTLTGYLEILEMNRVKDEEQRKRFVELSLAKSREIKELSDELFEYFLIYGEDNKKLEVEIVPASSLVEDLIYNQFLYLEENGYSLEVNNHVDEQTGNCQINSQYLQRVLNNILSNLEKYADKEKAIEISAAKEQNYLVLKVRNGIRKDFQPHESTKIGLVTCERIVKLHQGEFKTYEAENEFVVQLSIPLENE